jgi:hypothetical protein
MILWVLTSESQSMKRDKIQLQLLGLKWWIQEKETLSVFSLNHQDTLKLVSWLGTLIKENIQYGIQFNLKTIKERWIVIDYIYE